MRQSELYRAVARATGEPVDRLHRLGFSLVEVPPRALTPRRSPAQRAIGLRTFRARRRVSLCARAA